MTDTTHTADADPRDADAQDMAPTRPYIADVREGLANGFSLAEAQEEARRRARVRAGLPGF